VVTTSELKAQFIFLRQGRFMPLDRGILSLAGGPGVRLRQTRRMPRALDLRYPGECHLHVPTIRLCHPLVGYVQRFTIP